MKSLHLYFICAFQIRFVLNLSKLPWNWIQLPNVWSMFRQVSISRPWSLAQEKFFYVGGGGDFIPERMGTLIVLKLLLDRSVPFLGASPSSQLGC